MAGEARCAPALRARAERAERRLAFTEQWYAERGRRLEDLAKERGIWPEVATIIANGTVGALDPPTYAQQLTTAMHRAEAAEKLSARYRAALEELQTEYEGTPEREKQYRWSLTRIAFALGTAPKPTRRTSATRRGEMARGR